MDRDLPGSLATDRLLDLDRPVRSQEAPPGNYGVGHLPGNSGGGNPAGRGSAGN